MSRVGLEAAAWAAFPTRIVVDDHVVHIDSFPVGDDTVLITRGDRDVFSLLVVQPDVAPDAARSAMAQAVLVDNVSDAEQILIDTGSGRGPVGWRGAPPARLDRRISALRQAAHSWGASADVRPAEGAPLLASSGRADRRSPCP